MAIPLAVLRPMCYSSIAVAQESSEIIRYCNNKRAAMNLLCLALVATSFLTECASLDFSQPVSASEYQAMIKQGFATN